MKGIRHLRLKGNDGMVVADTLVQGCYFTQCEKLFRVINHVAGREQMTVLDVVKCELRDFDTNFYVREINVDITEV